MTMLEAWGWSATHEQNLKEAREKRPELGPLRAFRVTGEHRGWYVTSGERAELWAQVSPSLRKAYERGESLRPAVGDWVLISGGVGTDGIIEAVLPRLSILSRRAAGPTPYEQVFAANIDRVLILMAASPPPNLRKLERFLSMIRAGGAQPVVVITKTDLVNDISEIVPPISEIAGDAIVTGISVTNDIGLTELQQLLITGSTQVLVGSSGAGKSTLINKWIGEDRFKTNDVRADGKGRHTTTHRSLLQLPWGAMIVDTPGVRELALWDAEEGIDETFADIQEIAESCRFRDCEHTTEPGCAVQEAVRQGDLDADRVEGFRKLMTEQKQQRLPADQQQRATREKKAEAKRLSRAQKAVSKRKPRLVEIPKREPPIDPVQWYVRRNHVHHEIRREQYRTRD